MSTEEVAAIRAMATAVAESTRAITELLRTLPGAYVNKEVADLRWQIQSDDHEVLQTVNNSLNQIKGFGLIGPVVSSIITAVIVYAIIHH